MNRTSSSVVVRASSLLRPVGGVRAGGLRPARQACATGVASSRPARGVAWRVVGRRVGTGHGERAAITGTAGGERTRPSRRAAQRAAAVADMGCGERVPPSRRAARRTCTAGVASSRPALCACTARPARRAAWAQGAAIGRPARDTAGVRGWCEGWHGKGTASAATMGLLRSGAVPHVGLLAPPGRRG